MFRAILYALIGLLAFTFVRGVLSIIARGVSEMVRGAQDQSATPGAASGNPSAEAKPNFGGDLVKDPVCGTFVSTKSQFNKSAAGKTVYFCSAECRDKFTA